MSRIKQKKQGVINSLVWTQQDTNTASLSYDGTDFDFDSPVTIAGALTATGALTIGGAILAKATVSEAATTVLTAAESGSIFFIDGSTSAANYTLPATVAGLTFKWIWTANCNNAITITTADTTDTTGDMFTGGLLISSAAAVNNFLEVAADNNTITVDDNAADKAGGPGSWIEVICCEDAVWYVTGVINSTTDADSTGAHFSDTD